MWGATVERAKILVASAQATRGMSLMLKIRAQETRGVRSIAGSSDSEQTDDRTLATLVASIILEGPLCLTCIAKKLDAYELAALRAIERIQITLRVVTERGDRCRACGSTVGPVYSLARRD